MSLSAREQQTLDSIKDGLAGSDPQLAALLTTFTRLASGEEMPVREEIPVGSRPATRRPRRESRPGRSRPGLGYLRLQWAMLILFLVLTVVVITVTLVTSHKGGQETCIGFWSTICSRSAPG